MDFLMLGPLEVRLSGRLLPLGGPKDRLMLATLLLQPNRVVPVERLIDAIWDSPPASARKNVQTHIWGLRRLFTSSEGDGRIESTAVGYRLRVGEDELDAERFERLAGQGRRALSEGRPMLAAEVLHQAISLWRGPPLQDVALTPRLQSHVVALEEGRLAAVEDRIEAELRLGRHDALVGELRSLIAQHPLRERLHAQLMLALYRSGRQADALTAYTAARRALLDELGIEPGPGLERLQQDILRRAPALELAPATTSFPINQLPSDLADFTARSRQSEPLTRLLHSEECAGGAAVTVAVITGPPGVGKTSLAVHVGHLVAESFPDGILYASLRGPDETRLPAQDAIGGFLRALGVPSERVPDALPERSAFFRSLTAGKQYLIVLDNAFDEAQVRPLIPGSSGCAVLVTSRSRLVGLSAAETVALDVFSPAESAALLSRMLGAQRTNMEPDATEEVARLCGGLPLALRIAGGRLAARPAWPIAGLVRRLSDERERLAEFSAGDLELRTAFESAYHSLSADEQRLLRTLGGFGSDPFDAAAAAHAAGIGAREAGRLLERLADVHLVRVAEIDDRYRLHDLIRLFARDLTVADAAPAGG